MNLVDWSFAGTGIGFTLMDHARCLLNNFFRFASAEMYDAMRAAFRRGCLESTADFNVDRVDLLVAVDDAERHDDRHTAEPGCCQRQPAVFELAPDDVSQEERGVASSAGRQRSAAVGSTRRTGEVGLCRAGGR